jgi:(4S)-4-hydroxy-5-phosphonooxypentane-2,3-dione isomerase
MTATCVHIHVKPESVEEFIRITTANHLESVKEPGNLRFDLLQQPDDPFRFMIYEVYELEEQAAAHKNTAHYLSWRDAVKDMMAEPRFGVKYNVLQLQK